MANRDPSPSDVYRDKRGRLAVFVRTELRGGTSPENGAGPETPEHLFVVAQPELRAFATRWYRADEELPDTLELVVNTGAEHRIAELERQVEVLTAERTALAAAMKTAVGALPMQVAANLRRVYADTRARLLEGGA